MEPDDAPTTEAPEAEAPPSEGADQPTLPPSYLEEEPVAYADLENFPIDGILHTLLRNFVNEYLCEDLPSSRRANVVTDATHPDNTDELFAMPAEALFDNFRTEGTSTLLRLFMRWLADPKTREYAIETKLMDRRVQICDELQALAPALCPGNLLQPNYELKFEANYPNDHPDYNAGYPGYTWDRFTLILLNIAMYQRMNTEEIVEANLQGWLFLNPNFQELLRYVYEETSAARLGIRKFYASVA
jgi:hypothetical protein